jgi:hypothetical protein
MSSEEKNSMVADDEQVARIVSHEWVIDGELQLAAFALAPRETYLSVNRPIIDTYDEDVLQFVSAHPYYFDEKKQSYKRALLEVKAVRAISVEKDGLRLNANVEVEPRDSHTKSHAGIFVRVNGKNVVHGRLLPEGQLPYNVSEEYLLQQVQWDLLELAELQECRVSSE